MSTIYVDSPWAWGTVVGSFLANVIIGGISKAFGVVTEEYKEVLPGSNGLYMLAGGLIYTVMLLFSLVTHVMVEKVGARIVVMIGAILSSICLIVAANAETMTLWIIALGAGEGLALGCIYFNVISITGRCFRRYLGLANGIALSGVSIGQMIFPSIITHLVNVYSVRGGTYIIAGIFLHMLISGALMPRHIIDPDQPPPAMIEVPITNGKGDACSIKASSEMLQLKKNGKSAGEDVNNNNVIGPCNNHFHHRSQLSISTECESSKRRQNRMFALLLALYVVAKIFADVADVGISFGIPIYGKEFQFDEQMQYGFVMSGACDLLSRLFMGWLCDRPSIVGRRSFLLASVWIVEAVNAALWAEISYYPWSYNLHYVHKAVPGTQMQLVAYMACFAVHGMCSGAGMTLMVIVLMDMVGPDHLAKSLAITLLVVGLFYAPAIYFFGILKDLTGSFATSLRLGALFLLLSAIILLGEAPTKYWMDDPVSARHRKLRLLGGQDERKSKLEKATILTSANSINEANGSVTQPLVTDGRDVADLYLMDARTPPTKRWVVA